MKKCTNSTIIWTITGVLILVLMACTSTGTSYTSQTAAQPPAVTSTALRGTVEAAQVDQYMQSAHAQSTIDAGNVQLTLTALANQEAAATVAAQKTATAWAVTVAADQARTDALVKAAHITATADAQRDAEATRVARITETAEAKHATATAEKEDVTATAEMIIFNEDLTATKAANNAIATVQTARARKAELEAQREELVYPVKAYGPWVLLALAVGLMGYGFYRFIVVMEARQRVVQSEGSKNVIVLAPSGRVLKPQNVFGPVLDPEQRILPPTADEQLMVTENAQRIAAIRATHPPKDSGGSDNRTTRQRRYREAAGALPPRPQLQHSEPQTPGLRQIYDLRTLKHASQAGLLTPQMVQALEADWQQQIVEGEYREV